MFRVVETAFPSEGFHRFRCIFDHPDGLLQSALLYITGRCYAGFPDENTRKIPGTHGGHVREFFDGNRLPVIIDNPF